MRSKIEKVQSCDPESNIGVGFGREQSNEALDLVSEEKIDQGRRKLTFFLGGLLAAAGLGIGLDKLLKRDDKKEHPTTSDSTSESVLQEQQRQENQFEDGEIKEILGDFREMCKFYVKTSHSETLDSQNPDSVRQYIKKTAETYLFVKILWLDDIGEMESSDEESRSWDEIYDRVCDEMIEKCAPISEIVSGTLTQRETIEIPDVLKNSQDGRRQVKMMKKMVDAFHTALQVQDILKHKLSDVGLVDAQLDDFIDGRIGSKTVVLLKNILNGGNFYYIDSPLNVIVEEKKEQMLEELRAGELNFPVPRFSPEAFDYAQDIFHRLSQEHPITKELRKSMPEIQQCLRAAEKTMRSELAKMRGNYEKSRALQIALFNYHMDLWEGSLARSKGGNAHYPHEPEKWVDCTTFIYQSLRRMFPHLPKKIQLGGSKEQINDYARYLDEKPESGTNQNFFEPNIYIAGSANHVFMIGPDLKSGMLALYEGSGTVRKWFFVPETSMVIVGMANISSPAAIQKWRKDLEIV